MKSMASEPGLRVFILPHPGWERCMGEFDIGQYVGSLAAMKRHRFLNLIEEIVSRKRVRRKKTTILLKHPKLVGVLP